MLFSNVFLSRGVFVFGRETGSPGWDEKREANTPADPHKRKRKKGKSLSRIDRARIHADVHCDDDIVSIHECGTLHVIYATLRDRVGLSPAWPMDRSGEKESRKGLLRSFLD
jgi:hypothetical protein